jgi:hypothetical protein
MSKEGLKDILAKQTIYQRKNQSKNRNNLIKAKIARKVDVFMISKRYHVLLGVVSLAVVVVVAGLVDVVLIALVGLLVEDLTVVVEVTGLTEEVVVLTVFGGSLMVVISPVGFLLVWASCFVQHQITVRRAPNVKLQG